MNVIENEQQLRRTFEKIAKLYNVVDGIAASEVGHQDTRDAEIEGVRSTIRRLHRQIEAYYHSDLRFELDLQKPPNKMQG